MGVCGRNTLVSSSNGVSVSSLEPLFVNRKTEKVVDKDAAAKGNLHIHCNLNFK